MTNVEALKALYTALGGDAADVAGVTTTVEVLNAIAAKYEGTDTATTNAEAIAKVVEKLDALKAEEADLKKQLAAILLLPSENEWFLVIK